MNYMHLLVGHPTQNSKKFEVCYVLGDMVYVRPKRLKEDAKVAFIDWPDTVLGRLQAAYDRVPLKDDRDSVLVDYRKLVGCLKDAFIALTDGFYEPSELFEETCPDSDLRRVFLAALEIFEKDIPTVLRSKTNDIWDFLEELDTSKISDKAVFNRLQERYVAKGFSVFALPEALVGHYYGMIVGGSKTYQNSLFDLIHPFDALLLVHTSLTTLAKIEQGTFGSETIDGQLLNVIGDWLHYLDDVVDRQVTLDELSKERRVASYKAMFEKFLVYMLDFEGVSLDLFSDVSLSSVVLDELNEELLMPNMLTSAKDDAIADSVSAEVIPFKQTTSLLDDSLVSLTTATSELTNESIRKKGTFDSPFFYPWCDSSITDSDIVVTDKKPGFYTTGLEMVLDRLPPKDVLKNVYVDYGPLRSAVQLCLLQDVFDVRVMIDELMTVFDAIGRGDYANNDDLRYEKITFLRSGLIRCLLEIKGNVVSPLWDNQTDDQFGFDVKTVQRVLNNLSNIYGRNEGVIESWFSVSDETKGLIKQALDYVSDDTMFVKVPVSLKHTEFSDWLSDKECDALSQLLFFDAKKTGWYRSKAIEKDLMEQYKECSLLPLDFLKDDTVTNPSRYRKNKIEAWDFTIQSLLPHPLATVAEYVIRYPYKGGREDLEKAIAWAKKAEKSFPYLQATVGYGDSIVDDFPKVTKELFPDCSEGQRDVLRAVQKATLALRGSLGYGEPEDALREVTDGVKKLLEEM